jgi:hypothetical protein
MLTQYLNELSFDTSVAGHIVHDLWASGKLRDRGLDNIIDDWSEADKIEWLQELVVEVKAFFTR